MKSFVLVGNPNCGKTTLFNKLTNGKEHVGNWSGVTTDKKINILRVAEKKFYLVDLPGIYSLSARSHDEIIARDYILYERPDLIINILDANNLDRSLYLTTQLIETGLEIILVLNMCDEIKKNNLEINFYKLEKILDLHVINISAAKSIGINKLIDFIKNHEEKFKTNKFKSVLNTRKEYFYAKKIISYLEKNHDYSCSMLEAMKILEGDKNFLRKNILEKIFQDLNLDKKKSWDIIIAQDRYKFIDKLILNTVEQKKINKINLTDKLDKILLNKYLALPIFCVIIYLIFQVTFSFGGDIISDLINKFINNNLINLARNNLENLKVNNLIIDLITHGVMPGIGLVITFLPQIIILFLLLSFIEDSGYISRAAFIMDRPLKKIGLSGKSFVPIIMGFGCTVPAVMSTRILENKKDRYLTILLVPFISCSARMPLYVLITSIFFVRNRAMIILSLYLISMSLIIILGLIFNKIFRDQESSGFLLELPPYRMPTAKNLFIHVFNRVKDFVIHAGTVLPIVSFFIWLTENFDINLNYTHDNSKSMLALLGKFIAPVFTPLGFNDWRVCVALLTGLIAKETIVSSLSILFSPDKLAHDLKLVINPMAAYSYMIFIALYMPCISTMAVLKRELNSWKLALCAILSQVFIAWLIALVIYQCASLFIY